MNEYPLFKNAAFSNEFFSLSGRICCGGFSFNGGNVIFAAYFILRGCDMQLKKLISQMPEDVMFQIRRPL